ncbi:MAG TPA: aminomethyl-transferring glycine dehydrogenase subunit GcvPB [Chloroflexota bacterium]|nr:aminomethyl-transferring glycine dehydrogenase subunit GcvPB [Chloroflexota bacterium]
MFDLGVPGRRAAPPAACDVPEKPLAVLIPESYLRKTELALPELSELQVVRHFTRLSQRNYSIDGGFYPLGSCTMKYNPKLHEKVAAEPGWAAVHPWQPDATAQGFLQVLYELQHYLCAIAGMEAFSLQPAAGAHGELTGIFMIRAYHETRGEGAQRREVIVPDSAHGTNPASASAAGYTVVTVRSTPEGRVDVDELRRLVGPQTAALMLTNPNTCGLFERDIAAIARIVHDAGAQLYYDGANLNAVMGIARPGDMGFDVVHLNLHKTMTTPHGGGGPGTGPVGVKAHLAPFLPVPVVEQGDDGYRLSYDRPDSIGKVRSFWGNTGLLLRAYTYVRTLGPDGLADASRHAVLNANYLRTLLQNIFELPYAGPCMHEFVASARRYKRSRGVRTLDIAKRLIDYGFYPPTVYFPLIVEECLMVEPTETEDKQTLDRYAAALHAIVREIEESPATVTTAPHETLVGRIDEARAARQPDLRWRKKD